MVRTLVDGTAGLVIHVAEGPLSLDEIEHEFQATLESPAFRPGMRTVWDLRSASIDGLTADAIRALVEFNLARKERRGTGRAAIVAARDVDYGIARVFQAHAETLPWETMVFREFDEAVPWLHGSVDSEGTDANPSVGPREGPRRERVFVDPDRCLAWCVDIGLDIKGRFVPVFTRGSVELWADEEPGVGLSLLSEFDLHRLWWASHREVWHDNRRWCVRWQERLNLETWTWFECDGGVRRVIKEKYPFPYASWSELIDALQKAKHVE